MTALIVTMPTARRSTVVLGTYYFLTVASAGVFLPFLPTWLDRHGIHGFELSLIASTRSIMAVLGPIGFGLIADRLGLRGSLLRLASLGALIAMGLVTLGCAAGWVPSAALLFLLFGVFFFFRAPMMSLADVVALEQRASYGKIRLWGSIGFLTAALSAGLIVDPSSALAFPVATLTLVGLAFVLTLGMPARVARPAVPMLGAAKDLLRSLDFQLLLGTGLLWQLAHSGYDLTISLHLSQLGANNARIGLAWATATTAEVVLMAYSERLLRRWGAPRLLVVGMGLTGLRWILIATVTNLDLLLVLQVFHAASFALVFVAVIEYVKDRAHSGILATAQGVLTATYSVGSTLGTLIWGTLFAAAGGAVVFSALALVTLVGCGVAVAFEAVSRSRLLALPAAGVGRDETGGRAGP